jgi:hypothetical protein
LRQVLGEFTTLSSSSEDLLVVAIDLREGLGLERLHVADFW